MANNLFIVRLNQTFEDFETVKFSANMQWTMKAILSWVIVCARLNMVQLNGMSLPFFILEQCMEVIWTICCKAQLWVHPDPVSVSRGPTPIDVKDDISAEHHAGLSAPGPSVLFTQLLGSVCWLWISVGHFETVSAVERRWPHCRYPVSTQWQPLAASAESRGCLCDQKIKLCWSLLVCDERVWYMLVSDKCCLVTGRAEQYGGAWPLALF